MIWSKTNAGRAEMQSRSLVKERSQRNVLLLVDGAKSEETLLASVAGSTAADFAMLESLGLIVQAGSAGATVTEPAPLVDLGSPTSAATPAAAKIPATPQDYANFTATVTKLISSELGLRGFTLTLALEKAASIDELRAVAERVLQQINDRKGAAAAESARRKLYG